MKHMRLSLATVLSLAVLATLSVKTANAQIIYDNGVNTANSDNGFFSDVDFPQFVGDTFTLGALSSFNQVRFIGAYFAANSPLTDNFTISFYNTTAGTPDINPFVGGTFAVGSPGRTNIGVSPFGSDFYSYEVNLPSAVTLPAGTYGISIVNDTTDDTDDVWAWAASNAGAGIFFRTDQSSSWDTNPGDVAFTLVNTSAAAAPEPGTLLFLLPVVAGVAMRCKQCKS